MISANSMIETLKDYVERLNDLEIQYMVPGSFAMSAYATARMTMDINVIIEIEQSDAARFSDRFSDAYYVNVNSIERAVQSNSMFNILSNMNGVKVDCIVRKPTELEKAKFARRRLTEIDGVSFWVISKEDLIMSKLEWAKDSHSEKQFLDIRGLIESGVDDESLRNWVDRLDLKKTWDAFEKWKIRLAK